MSEVYKQLYCLAIFTLVGIVIGILFDSFRILRRSFKTVDLITYIQDILFWILTGVIVLFSIFKFNNGEIRSYIFFGMALGLLIYILTISKFVIKYTVIVINWAKKILSYPIKLLTEVFKNIIIKPALFIINMIKSIFSKKKVAPPNQ